MAGRLAPQGIPPVGALSVACPVCRSYPGRPCANRRGYLLDEGSHSQRRALWLDQERAEARRREARTAVA
jgi:hypothetical protein